MPRRSFLLGLALLFLVLGAVLFGKRQPRPADTDGRESVMPRQTGSFPPYTAPPAVAQQPASGQEAAAARGLWQERLARAEFTLKQYVQSTRYPPSSRPLREHPDRIYPRAPVTRTLPLGSQGQPQEVQIQLSQDRLNLVEDDSARLTVRCVDSLGAAVPCSVEGARAAAGASGPAAGSARLPPAPIEFADDGDAHSTVFQPAQQGFRGYSGPLRVTFTVRAGGETSSLFFDLLYTGDPPARFTGKVREAVEAGSLQLYVGITVQKPGRYVITGRVDDASDRPFAYLQFNDLLQAGPQEVKLTVFGKLIVDDAPQWPCKLRDLDGFLLFPDQDPDRQELAMLAGVAYKTQPHTPGEFSPDEWQSPERQRHITEFTKDVDTARSQLHAAQ
jgi:hypothetical protein